MRNGRDSSEDGSHRGFAQPAGLRRCWIVAALLSRLPGGQTSWALRTIEKGDGLCQEGCAIVPSASELQEAELGGEGGGCGTGVLLFCPKRRDSGATHGKSSKPISLLASRLGLSSLASACCPQTPSLPQSLLNTSMGHGAR